MQYASIRGVFAIFASARWFGPCCLPRIVFELEETVHSGLSCGGKVYRELPLKTRYLVCVAGERWMTEANNSDKQKP